MKLIQGRPRSRSAAFEDASRLVNGENPKNGSVLLPTLSRRQLLRGVAGSAAVSLLVALTPEGSAQATTSQLSTMAVAGEMPLGQDILWIWGSDPDAEGVWLAQGLDSTGTIVAKLTADLPPIVRAPDRLSLVTVSPPKPGVAGWQSTVNVHSAADGELIRSIVGQPLEGGQSEALYAADIAVSEDGQRAVVLHLLTSLHKSGVVVKKAPWDDRTDQVPTGTWESWRAIEVFNLGTGRSEAILPLPSDPDSLSVGQVLLVGDQILLYGAGNDLICTVDVFTIAPASPGQVVIEPTGSVDAGESLGLGFLSADSSVADVATGSIAQLIQVDTLAIIDLNAHSVAATMSVFPDSIQRAAKPFPSFLVPAARGQVCVANPSLQFAAIVDLKQAAVVVSADLNTFAGGAMGSPLAEFGVASDASSDRLYIADGSGVKGGIWVLSLSTLEVLDRWLSSTSFDAVWAAGPDLVFGLATDSQLVFVFDGEGQTKAVARAPFAPVGVVR